MSALLRSLPDAVGSDLLEGTVTIAFADLENSTALVQSIGDVEFSRLIHRLDETARDLAQSRRGFVPRFEGDGWMIVFGSARRALEWALDLQSAVAAMRSTPDGGKLRVRIGIHTGEAVQDGRDFLGQHVNLASRICSAAEGGTVLASSVTATVARGGKVFEFRNPQLVTLRGFDEPQEILEVARAFAQSEDVPQRVPTETTS